MGIPINSDLHNHYRRFITSIFSGSFIIIALIGCGFIQSLGVLDIGIPKKFNADGETDYQAMYMVQAGREYGLTLTSMTYNHIGWGIDVAICDKSGDLVCDKPISTFHNADGSREKSIEFTFTAPSNGQIYIHIEWIADKSDKLGEYEVLVQPH